MAQRQIRKEPTTGPVDPSNVPSSTKRKDLETLLSQESGHSPLSTMDMSKTGLYPGMIGGGTKILLGEYLKNSDSRSQKFMPDTDRPKLAGVPGAAILTDFSMGFDPQAIYEGVGEYDPKAAFGTLLHEGRHKGISELRLPDNSGIKLPEIKIQVMQGTKRAGSRTLTEEDLVRLYDYNRFAKTDAEKSATISYFQDVGLNAGEAQQLLESRQAMNAVMYLDKQAIAAQPDKKFRTQMPDDAYFKDFLAPGGGIFQIDRDANTPPNPAAPAQ